MLPPVSHLKALLLPRLEVEADPDSIDGDTPLFEGGLGLDSFAIVDMIMVIEDRFGVTLSDEDLTVENFDSLQAISALIGRCLARDGKAEP